MRNRALYYLDLVRVLAFRDLKVRYEGTLLGFAWAMVNPLLFAAVFYFVFVEIIAIDIPRFSAFVLIGLVSYGWFQSAVTQASKSVVNNRDLVRRPRFSVATLPLIPVVTSLVHFLLILIVLALVLLLVDRVFSWAILMLPVVISIQFLFTLAVAFFVSAANVVFRDSAHLIDLALRLGYFLSPIFYQASMVPDLYAPYYRLNPLVSFLESYRAILIDREVPVLSSLVVVTGCSFVLLMLCYQFFSFVRYRFAEEL